MEEEVLLWLLGEPLCFEIEKDFSVLILQHPEPS